jgi:hypothetical protein
MRTTTLCCPANLLFTAQNVLQPSAGEAFAQLLHHSLRYSRWLTTGDHIHLGVHDTLECDWVDNQGLQHV